MEYITLRDARQELAAKGIELNGAPAYLRTYGLDDNLKRADYGEPLGCNENDFDTDARIARLFVDAVLDLSPHYEWQVVDDNHNNTVTNVNGLMDGTIVGHITINNYSDTIELRNEKIRKAMERKDYIESGTAAKIRKDIKRYFKPLSLPEQLEVRHKSMRRRMDREDREARYKWNDIAAALKCLAPYIMQNFDHYKPILREADFNGDLDKLRDTYDEAEIVTSVTQSPQSTAVLLTDEYCVARSGKKNTVYPLDQMPTKMRSQLGMLKLLDDETFAVGIGYKDKPDLFVLVGDYHE